MEKPEFIIGKHYSDILKTMWFTFFFCPIIPVCSIITLIGLIIYYWMSKYSIIKMKIIKESVSK
jgi:hypothetical protein